MAPSQGQPHRCVGVRGVPQRTRVGNRLDILKRGFQVCERADSWFPNYIWENSGLFQRHLGSLWG